MRCHFSRLIFVFDPPGVVVGSKSSWSSACRRVISEKDGAVWTRDTNRGHGTKGQWTRAAEFSNYLLRLIDFTRSLMIKEYTNSPYHNHTSLSVVNDTDILRNTNAESLDRYGTPNNIVHASPNVVGSDISRTKGGGVMHALCHATVSGKGIEDIFKLRTAFKPALALAKVETFGAVGTDMSPATPFTIRALKT